ncbi:MAG: phage holin [Clostridia bacterium]|nr:phage holin [Clostridia bacterium]
MKTETIIRTVVLAVALINQILAICGKDTIALYESDIAQLITIIVTIGSSLWAWWKNNSFTRAAIEADSVLESLRTNESEPEEDEESEGGGE